MNTNHKEINRYKTVALIIAGILIGIVIGYAWASSSSKSTITPGICPGAPSYTVWKEDSTCYAKNAYGAMLSGYESGSTNAKQIIQDVIDQIATYGGMIYFKSGNYIIDNTLVIQITSALESMTIIGEDKSTNITFTGNGDAFRFISSPGKANQVIMENLLITVGNNIDIVFHFYRGNSLKYSRFYNIDIVNPNNPDPITEQQTGIYLDDEDGEGGIYFNNFQDITFYDIYTGIRLIGAASNGPNVNTFTNLLFYHGKGYGIFMNAYADANRFQNLNFEDVNGTQIYTDSNSNTFTDVWIEVVPGATAPFQFGSNSNNNVLEMKGQNYGTLNYLNLDDGTNNRIIDYSTNQDFYNKRAINDAGYFQLVCIAHPNNSTWTSAKNGYMWYCTTHNRIEHYVYPAIYYLSGAGT